MFHEGSRKLQAGLFFKDCVSSWIRRSLIKSAIRNTLQPNHVQQISGGDRRQQRQLRIVR
ncbi:MAG: hypothetical protein JWM83_1181 [Candidatus Angelobacter sp.]|jgi:hypothetical protein|nr:hypothetical protein [Candidatus Angelobacter sp.]